MKTESEIREKMKEIEEYQGKDKFLAKLIKELTIHILEWVLE